MNFLITCEHAGNEVPKEFSHLFENQYEALHSHRGWDPGALEIARYLSTRLNTPLYYQPITRLLVEMNRSLHSSQLFSEYTKNLSNSQRDYLLQTYYHPYRHSIINNISTAVKPVIHLSIHSFTPVWNGETRHTDIGLLFDPARKHEFSFSKVMQQRLNQLSDFQVDFNKPYLGTDDGLTTFLRTKFSDENYCGIEIEVNQKYAPQPEALATVLLKALA